MWRPFFRGTLPSRLAAAPALTVFCAVLLAPEGAVAQGYPAKPVRILVGVPPGGGTDILARVLARRLADVFGQQFVVENRPGAGTVIAADLVAKAAPDGHTLLLAINALAANHTLYKKLPYNTLRDFSAVILAASTPNILVAHPSLPAANVLEFIALAKARPGEIAYASSGNGSAAYLAAEVFKLATATRMTHVPYKGTGPALTAILAGEAQAMVAALPGAIPFVKEKRLRALALTSAKRAPTVPDIPTLAEAGIKGGEFDTWYGLFAPAATPADIVLRLNATVKTLLASVEVRQQLAAQGLEPAGNTPAEFDKYFRGEVETLARVIRAAGATVD
jgi:tripartite-type tricarboxylate transporter receptor subunit TctC